MYWIVGCPPGGSAGTSFCRGTEISINLRAMAFPRWMFLVGDVAGSRLLPLDPVLQRADLFDFEFDGIAVLEIPAEFEAAAIADGAGSDELAGHQGLVLADMGDDLLEREQHALGH